MPYNPGVSYTGGQAWGNAFQSIGQSVSGAMIQRGQQKQQRKQYETILGALDPENYNADTLSALSLAELEGELQARTLKQADAIRAAEQAKQEAQRNEAIMRMEETVRKRNADRVDLGAYAHGMQVAQSGGENAIPLAVQEYQKRGGSNPKNFIEQIRAVSEMNDDVRRDHALSVATQVMEQSGDASAAQDAYFANGGTDMSLLRNQLQSMAQMDRGFEPEVKEPGSLFERGIAQQVERGNMTQAQADEMMMSYVKNAAEGRGNADENYLKFMMLDRYGPEKGQAMLNMIYGGNAGTAMAEPGSVQPIAPGGDGGMPSYATEADVEAAMQRGEIAEGDVIMLNGRRVKVGG